MTDQEFKEIDVEWVLQKQTTHDLFCPNCRSCISERVIQQRRNQHNVRKIRIKPKLDRTAEYASGLSCTAAEPASSQNVDFSQPAAIIICAPGVFHQWDILKSIVYGGLIESITSSGLVFSAAASGASTLSILVMGLANLMGGLFIIAHNLRELKNDRSGETSFDMNEQGDRYQQVLGRRENFALHATVVILSFLIFGLTPPVTYGFSFPKSDNRDNLKIAAVSASSLVCIILLAIGKGHIQRPPRRYIRTVLYYVTIGILTSSLSYVVGELIKKPLEKLNLFESGLDVTVPFPETNLMKQGWASY